MAGRSELIVVGNGMVGHRFVELLIAEGRTTDFRVTVIGEEPRPAYDRVGLSSYFAGKTADDLTLVEPGSYERAGIDVRRGDRVTAIDRAGKTVTLASGDTLRYDQLVLATGSYPFVPPVPGATRPAASSIAPSKISNRCRPTPRARRWAWSSAAACWDWRRRTRSRTWASRRTSSSSRRA